MYMLKKYKKSESLSHSMVKWVVFKWFPMYKPGNNCGWQNPLAQVWSDHPNLTSYSLESILSILYGNNGRLVPKKHHNIHHLSHLVNEWYNITNEITDSIFPSKRNHLFFPAFPCFFTSHCWCWWLTAFFHHPPRKALGLPLWQWSQGGCDLGQKVVPVYFDIWAHILYSLFTIWFMIQYRSIVWIIGIY